MARYLPQLLAFALYVVGLWHRELYLLFFGLGVTVSSLLNWGVNALLSEHASVRIVTCVPLHGAVLSFETQQIAFFTAFLVSYICLYEAPATTLQYFLIVGVLSVAFVGDVLLNYHREQAIISGAVLGFVLAFLYQWFLYVAAVPLFPWLERKVWVRWFDYRDTLCNTRSTSALGTSVLQMFDATFGTDGNKLVRSVVVVAAADQQVRAFVTQQLRALSDEQPLPKLPTTVSAFSRSSEFISVGEARSILEELFSA